MRHRHRGARRASRPTRSPAWRPSCASAARRRSRARSSPGSRPGRTGSSSGPTRSDPKGALQGVRHRRAGRIRPQESVMARHRLQRAHPQQRRPRRATAGCSARSRTGSRRFLEWWKDMGPDGLPGQRRLPAHRDQRGRQGLGQVRLREDAGVPLGHLPRRAGAGPRRSTSATTRASPRGRRCPASTAATLRRLIVTQGDTEPASVEQQRHLGRTVPVALRPAQPLPGQRGGGPPPVGDGLPARTPTSAATAARRRRRCCSAAPATPTSRASSAPSTSGRRTGSRSSCSPSSPTATASTSSRSLAESGFDPLSRTCRFMLTEEAHHMFVGESGRAGASCSAPAS